MNSRTRSIRFWPFVPRFATSYVCHTLTVRGFDVISFKKLQLIVTNVQTACVLTETKKKQKIIKKIAHKRRKFASVSMSNGDTRRLSHTAQGEEGVENEGAKKNL